MMYLFPLVNTHITAKALSFGLWGAIILRGVFIAAGAVALEQFHQILLAFAAVLYVSSYKILFAGGEDEEEEVRLF